MSTTVKVILGIIVGIVILCIGLAVGGTALVGLVGYQVVKNVSTSAQEAEQMAAEVADFELPAGYRSEYGLRAMGINISAYSTDQPNTHLFIAQAGPGSNLDVEDVERMIREAKPENNQWQNKALKQLRQEQITLRGKPATLLVSEGVNSEDQPYLEMTVLFEGKGGPALVNISAPASVWDEEANMRFIQSIH